MNRWLLAVGVGCVAVGAARVLGVLPWSLPGGAYGFVALAVLAAVAAGVALARDGRAASDCAVADPPKQAGPRRPGASPAAALEEVSVVGRRRRGVDDRRGLHARLAAVAVDVLAAKRDVTPAVARAQLDAGTWTDDPDAAAFFAAGPVPSLSARDQFEALRSGEPPYARRARAAIAELDAVERDREATEPDAVERDRAEAEA